MPLTLEICQGTTCFVMGSSELLEIGDMMPERWRDKVDIRGVPCLDRCKNARYGRAPYARLDGEIVEAADTAGLLRRIAEKLGDSSEFMIANS